MKQETNSDHLDLFSDLKQYPFRFFSYFYVGILIYETKLKIKKPNQIEKQTKKYNLGD